MIRRPPRSTQSRSSAASDVYKRQVVGGLKGGHARRTPGAYADCRLAEGAYVIGRPEMREVQALERLHVPEGDGINIVRGKVSVAKGGVHRLAYHLDDIDVLPLADEYRGIADPDDSDVSHLSSLLHGEDNHRVVLGLSLIHISEPTRLGMISYAV